MRRAVKPLSPVVCVLAACILAGCFGQDLGAIPRFDHVVVVIEENKSAEEVMGSPYLASLAAGGAFFTRSFGVAHPSQPNYIALFSGDTQGVADNYTHDIAAANLHDSLSRVGLSAAGYSEDLPAAGFRGGAYRKYARKHNPFVSFRGVPDSANLPFSSFPGDYSLLPTVCFVVPNLDNDMHDGSVLAGDAWLRANIDGYARWAGANNSLLIVTFDEGPTTVPVDRGAIATIFSGAHVKPGRYEQRIDHYTVLATILEMYGAAPLGSHAPAGGIKGVWE